MNARNFHNFDLEYILWLRLLHTAENHGPTMFHMATVRHKRWDPCLLYRTSLSYIGCNCLDFALTFNAGVTVIRINVYLYSYPLSDELTMYGLSG